MKHFFTLLTILMIGWIPASAQQRGDERGGRERLEALKIAYLTKELNLTAEEAQKFWPVYNQYIAEMRKLRQDTRGDEITREEKLLSIRKKYQSSFGKTLSPERANHFFKAEKEFYGKVQKELQQRRQHRGDSGRPSRNNPRQ
ncbi:MAG TPA: hypothetical protein VIK80_02720 [Flavihumibacter sp.]|jgi:hypothetical protein